MGRCGICRISSAFISAEVGACGRCLREHPEEALPLALQAHSRSRAAFGLPPSPPEDPQGARCSLCMHRCRIPPGGKGYCGLRRNDGRRLKGGKSSEGKLFWYHDQLPTNCVGEFVCPGGTGSGYPRYAHLPGPERGYRNLAVFFQACNFNCLYCQNWQFRMSTLKPGVESPSSLASAVDERTSCICYFGGDPTPQAPFALRVSRLAMKRGEGILRICWETNGSMASGLLKKMLDLSLISGGCIKFDLKAWDEGLHRALTGVSNARTLENFASAAQAAEERRDPQLTIASTLIVPGYIDEKEVRSIARFVASIDPETPYSLLGFHPCFYMQDLPLTPASLARRCLEAAKDEGLKRVHIGNIHLLSPG
ncbi:MAG: radical SAM protein [Methanothrix sp.]|nr:radical SAM protein [Methanothrix sp.]